MTALRLKILIFIKRMKTGSSCSALLRIFDTDLVLWGEHRDPAAIKTRVRDHQHRGTPQSIRHSSASVWAHSQGVLKPGEKLTVSASYIYHIRYIYHLACLHTWDKNPTIAVFLLILLNGLGIWIINLIYRYVLLLKVKVFMYLPACGTE